MDEGHPLESAERSLYQCTVAQRRGTRSKPFVLSLTLLAPLLAALPLSGHAETLERDMSYLWWARIFGSHWEYPFVNYRPHVLAVWTRPRCYGQQFHGSGGYQDTCSSGHGCIDQWTWWTRSPQSKLGVPGSGWLVPWRTDRRAISNYSAACWFD